MASPDLPHGVSLRGLQSHPDGRGMFTEVFRQSWDTGITPVQWSIVHDRANVLRGVHVHYSHSDYLIVVQGSALIGLKDIREGSPTRGHSAMLTLDASQMRALFVPEGVAHGFYFPQDSIHLYAQSGYWSPGVDLGCRWDDPALGLAFPCQDPALSDKDRDAPPFARMVDEYRARAAKQ